MPIHAGNTDFLRKIKSAVTEIEPLAEVILYGSRARGLGSSGSDWDILVLVDQETRSVRQSIRRRLYEIEWACGEVVSVVIREKSSWNHPQYDYSPFHRNVQNEGIRL